MKKFSAYFIALLSSLILLAGCSDDTQPIEGKQYSQLPADLSVYKLQQVTEVFSLNCGHCRQMESMIPELEKLTNQQIGRLHVTFNQSAQIGAMMYYAAVMQLHKDPDHTMMEALFAAVQMGDGSTLSERQAAIEKVFHERNLTSPYELDESQQKLLFSEMKVAENVSKKGEINAVPTFIVNGQYLINTSAHRDINDIANTINFLTQQPE